MSIVRTRIKQQQCKLLLSFNSVLFFSSSSTTTGYDGDGDVIHPIPNRPLRGSDRPPPPPPPSSSSQFQDTTRSPRRTKGCDNNPFSTKLDSRVGTSIFTRFGSAPNGEEAHTNNKSDSQQPRAAGTTAAGQAFLEKFKLGFDNATNKNPIPQQPEQQTPPPQTVPEDADEIFKKMKETGLIPNAVAMLDGLCKDGLVQEAMKLFGLMREKGTIPEVVIYTAVVEGFCKAHKFEDAKRILRKMQNNGIVPNVFSYTVLIQGLCRGKCLEDAVDFCVEMLEAGYSPNVATFISIIDGFCKEKGVEEAETVVRRLREKDFFVDEKAVKQHLDKKGPFSPLVWEAIFGKNTSKRLF